MVNTCVPILRDLDARGGKKHTYTHTNTRDNYCNPRCGCVLRVNNVNSVKLYENMMIISTFFSKYFQGGANQFREIEGGISWS